MRCAGPARFAAPALMGKGDGESDAAPALMGKVAASSSSGAAGPDRVYSVEQVAAAENRNKAPFTPSADINATLRR
eukprot:12269131-Heterocapsa_arctica.AAC.1